VRGIYKLREDREVGLVKIRKLAILITEKDSDGRGNGLGITRRGGGGAGWVWSGFNSNVCGFFWEGETGLSGRLRTKWERHFELSPPKQRGFI